MKRKNRLLILTLAITAILFSCRDSKAQERTISKTMRENATYYKYSGTAADTLTPTNQDTIDFVLQFRNDNYVKKIAVKSRFDMITTADTTVAISVDGKEFEDHTTYTSVIASSLSDAVTANNTVAVDVNDPYNVVAAHTLLTDTTGLSGYPADSIAVPSYNVTPFDKSYRFYRFRYILSGNDATGTGVKIDEIEVKFYTD